MDQATEEPTQDRLGSGYGLNVELDPIPIHPTRFLEGSVRLLPRLDVEPEAPLENVESKNSALVV